MTDHRTAERHRNARLARNLKTADVMTLDEVIAMVREYTRSFMDVPSPRANQLADEVERLRAVLAPPGLPSVLSSVADVGAVCEAAGLASAPNPPRWLDGNVRVQSRGDVVFVNRNRQRLATVFLHSPSSLLWHAITAARQPCPDRTETETDD